MKIVTLIPSATEIVAFLGQKKSIVGRSHECDFPQDLSKIIKLTEPKIDVEGTSGEIHEQIEVILEKSLSVYKVHVDELKKLNPDFIVTQSHCEVCAVSFSEVENITKKHLGKNTKSKIISKGISAGNADNMYRGLVDIKNKAINSRNYTQCDSLLMGNKCGAHTIPYIKNSNATSTIEHEATTTKINEEQLHYCNQRGLDQEEAVSLIVNGFCKEVLQQLPMEFAVEAQKLVAISLEGSVG